MNRLVLLALGVVLVLLLLLAPQPAPRDQFGLALQNLAVRSTDNPLGLRTVLEELATTGQEVTAPVRLALGDVKLSGFPADFDHDAARQQAHRALERAVNQLNRPATDGGEPVPAMELLPAATTEVATVSLALDIESRKDGSRRGLAVVGTYSGAQLGQPVLFPDAAAPPAAPWYPERFALLPPLIAILMAIAFRRVLLSLFAGVWLAGAILTWYGDLTSPWKAHIASHSWGVALWEGLLRSLDHFFWNQLTDTFRFEMIGFVLFLCAAVGVMARSGGMAGLVRVVARIARGVRSSQLATYIMGLTIFFDDYANCILVGSTMRPVTDRLRIAREKLAFLVDATAAPVAAICMLSTWIAFEVSTFSNQLPSVGLGVDQAYAIFVRTLPFRFYAIFMLGFILLNILVQRDFGPMLAAERRARRSGALVRPGGRPLVSDRLTRLEPRADMPPLARRAVLPILTVLLVTIGMIWHEGGGPWFWTVLDGQWQWRLPTVDLDQARGILQQGSGPRSILFGSFAGLVMALFLSVGWGGRLGLILGWLGAAWAARPLALRMVDRLREQLVQSPEGFLSGYASDTLDLSVGGALEQTVVYMAFGAVFVVAVIVLGFLAAAFLSGERGSGDRLSAVDAFRSALSSTQALFFAVVILFLAWMIGEACSQLGTATYLVALIGDSVPYWMLPLLLFLISCLVSFATGSAWSTMGLILPIVVVLAFHIGEATPATTGFALMVLSIGAVLEGSIFGDHCSPISDTTVLSSVASASDHIDHVRTQMPYATVVMVTALLVGYLPQALGLWSPWVSAAGGLGFLLLVLLVFGRNPNVAPQAEEATGSRSYPPLVAGAPTMAADPLATAPAPAREDRKKNGDEPTTGRIPPWLQ